MYKEGKAVIKYTKESFLNSEGRLSRDISSAYVAAFSNKRSSILDATAATGIRGIRYYLESNSRAVTLLEMNRKAFPSMKKNVVFNKVKANALGKNIQEFTNTTDKKFDFIDLDPFGGVTPYIYDLMKVAKDGTRLMVTATDMAVLCGADYKACLRLYDAKPMHNELCHEVALRILIGYIVRIAAQFNFGVSVELSFDYLHYVRVFLQLRHGSKNAIDSIKKLGYVYYCNKCLNRGIDKSSVPTLSKCNLCGNPLDTAGKVWLGNLYNKDVVGIVTALTVQGESEKIYGKDSLIFVEGLSKEADFPLYYSIPRFTSKMKMGAVSPDYFIDRLVKKGFKATKTHMERSAIKTNATITDIKKCVKI